MIFLAGYPRQIVEENGWQRELVKILLGTCINGRFRVGMDTSPACSSDDRQKCRGRPGLCAETPAASAQEVFSTNARWRKFLSRSGVIL